MKTLILIFHPDMDTSVINKRWRDELARFPEKYTVRSLYDIYPDEKINVEEEQKIIEEYDKIIIQFPVYWFSSPSFLKKYLDEILTYGWAYGSQSGYKVSGKSIGLCVSAGIGQQDYSLEGRYKYTLEEIFRPLEVTINYVKAEYKSFFAYYDIEQNSSEEWIEASVKPLIDYIDSI